MANLELKTVGGEAEAFVREVLLAVGEYGRLLWSSRPLDPARYRVVHYAGEPIAALGPDFLARSQQMGFYDRVMSSGDEGEYLDPTGWLEALCRRMLARSSETRVIATDCRLDFRFYPDGKVPRKMGRSGQKRTKSVYDVVYYKTQICLTWNEQSGADLYELLDRLCPYTSVVTVVPDAPSLVPVATLSEEAAVDIARRTVLVAVPVFDDESWLIHVDHDAYFASGRVE